MSTDLTRTEQWMLRDALRDRHARAARQRAITERDLAEGFSDVDVLTRLAYHEELDLAAIDGLRAKLLPGWMR